MRRQSSVRWYVRGEGGWKTHLLVRRIWKLLSEERKGSIANLDCRCSLGWSEERPGKKIRLTVS